MLIVEDLALYSEALVRRLEVHCDVRTRCVESSLHALQLLNAETFDLVVADMRLPGLQGTKLLLMAAEKWPAMRRVLLTGYTSGELVVEASGFVDAVFDKVMDLELICDAICRLASSPRN